MINEFTLQANFIIYKLVISKAGYGVWATKGPTVKMPLLHRGTLRKFHR